MKDIDYQMMSFGEPVSLFSGSRAGESGIDFSQYKRTKIAYNIYYHIENGNLFRLVRARMVKLWPKEGVYYITTHEGNKIIKESDIDCWIWKGEVKIPSYNRRYNPVQDKDLILRDDIPSLSKRSKYYKMVVNFVGKRQVSRDELKKHIAKLKNMQECHAAQVINRMVGKVLDYVE